MPKFIKTELESESDSDLERMEAKIDNELESSSDNDSVYDTVHWFLLFIIAFIDDSWLISLMIIDDYWWLLIVSVVGINGG